jgi:hypothetical protein
MREPSFRFYTFSWGSPPARGHFDRERWPALLVRWLMLAFSVWVAAEVVGGIHLEGLVSILAVAAILGLLNLYLRPVLFVLSLPFTIVTLGFFIVIINELAGRYLRPSLLGGQLRRCLAGCHRYQPGEPDVDGLLTPAFGLGKHSPASSVDSVNMVRERMLWCRKLFPVSTPSKRLLISSVRLSL